MIPNIIPYEKDEFIYSWICRLAIANGFTNVQDFFSIYINPFSKFTYNNINIHFLEKHLPSFNKENILQLVFETSLYPFLSIFMKKRQQVLYLNNLLSDPSNKFYKDMRRTRTKINKIKICPNCKNEEEEKKGFYYIHRSHQLQGVKVCHKHKCKLKIIDDYPKSIFKKPFNTYELELTADLEVEYTYAKFVHELLYANLDSNKEELNNILETEIKKRKLSSKKELLINIHNTSKLAPLLYSRKFTEKKQNFKLNVIEICVIFYELFRCVENIPVPFLDNSQLIEQLHKENYSVVSPFRRNIFIMKHNDCNTTFINTIYGFEDGWDCPLCANKTNNITKFKKIVYKSTSNEYSAVSDFEGWSKDIIVKHNVCNNTYSISPQKFYFDESRCNCKKKLTFDEVKKRVERYNGFHLIKYTRQSDHVEIYSEKCGHQFKVILTGFEESPFCRECRPYKMTLTEFKEKVKMLTGNEYIVMGDYFYEKNTKKIKIYHTKCSQDFPIIGHSFLKGQRCPYCSRKLTYKELCKFVFEKTNGFYKCIANSSKHKGPITLQNTQTHEMICLPKYLIIQEINRPTSSEILKYNKQNNVPYLDEKLQYLEYIKSKYSISDLFFPQDFDEQDKLKKILAYLSRNKIIHHISLGVYSITFHTFNPEEISYRFYEKKNNQIIGYRIGDDFLQTIGYNTRKPEKLTITTKRCPYGSRTQTYRGAKTTIYQCYYPILDSKSLMILPVIDTIRLLKYGDNKALFNYLATYLKKSNISFIDLEEYLSYYPDQCRRIIKNRLKKGGFT